MEEAFTKIYNAKTWVNENVAECPKSGPGSTMEVWKPSCDYLATYILKHGIKSVVEVGCGNFMGITQLFDILSENGHQVTYLGIDIVDSVIEENRVLAEGMDHVSFEKADITDPDWVVPKCDLMITRDVLQHLPNNAIMHVLWQFHNAIESSQVGHILMINANGQTRDWWDIQPGDFRYLSPQFFPLKLAKWDRLAVFDSPESRTVWKFNGLKSNTTPRLSQPPEKWPLVTIAILAKDKALVLPWFLKNIQQLVYPKDRINLYIRTNNNRDNTEQVLRGWYDDVKFAYNDILIDTTDLDPELTQYKDHEWNGNRFKALGGIRQASMNWALETKSDFYYVQDVDNFVHPDTLFELVNLNLPIVAPLLRLADNMNRGYANYHSATDSNGYFADHPSYFPLLHRVVKGVCLQPVVHCTYLIRADAIPKLTYDDDTWRYEYVIFSDSARKNNVPQYLDTRKNWGWLTMQGEEETLRIGALLSLMRFEDTSLIR